MKRIVFAGAGLALVLAFVLGASAYKSWRASQLGFMAQERAHLFVRPHSPRLGDEDAKVYLVKFTDPACETCAAFGPFVEQAIEANPGKLQLVIRYLPLHQGARDVARMLEASRRQGKVWETLHALYEHQDGWTHNHRVNLDDVWQFLPEGLDLERLRADMRDPEVIAVVDQDLADAAVLGVRKTPGFFVNGKPLQPFGARPLAELIRTELQAQYPD